MSLNVARCAVAGWIAAAVMFVITAVREVTSPDFSSTVRGQLALLRFPVYYEFGFTLVPLAIVATLFACRRYGKVLRALRWAAGLLSLVLALMVVDYISIFSPMVAMLTAEAAGEARPANFITYHRASETVNGVGVLLCSAALVLLCVPDGACARGGEGVRE